MSKYFQQQWQTIKIEGCFGIYPVIRLKDRPIVAVACSLACQSEILRSAMKNPLAEDESHSGPLRSAVPLALSSPPSADGAVAWPRRRAPSTAPGSRPPPQRLTPAAIRHEERAVRAPLWRILFITRH